MEHLCNGCDKTSKTKPKKFSQFRSLTHIEIENCIQTEHTIQKPIFLTRMKF